MKFGKLIVLSVVLLVCFSMIPYYVSADTDVSVSENTGIQKAQVSTSGEIGQVKVYKSPQADSEVVTILQPSTEVSVLERGSEYTQVSYFDQKSNTNLTGYIENEFLTDIPNKKDAKESDSGKPQSIDNDQESAGESSNVQQDEAKKEDSKQNKSDALSEGQKKDSIKQSDQKDQQNEKQQQEQPKADEKIVQPKKMLTNNVQSTTTYHGVALKSPTKVFETDSTASSVLKQYTKGSILKYKSYSDDWYVCTVILNNKAHTGYIKKSDVDNSASPQKNLQGIGTKSLTKVYEKASTGAKVLKSYAQGSTLQYKTFTSNWYECTVYIKGKAHTGYINKNDVEVPTATQKNLRGIGTKSPTKVYAKASTGAKVLKSYAQGSTLQYKTFTSNWYECTVYIKGKAHTGYINKNDVEVPTTTQKNLRGIGTKSPTKVYEKASTGAKVLKSYSKGSILKYKTYTSDWYECTVYLKGKATTGYIKTSTVENAVSNQKAITGSPIKTVKHVYAKASTSSKILKTYSKGAVLKYKTFTSDWYECTVYLNGKPTTGYIYAKADPDQDQGIKGKTIVLDPGHGGNDPGATGVDGTREKTINLAYAKVVKQDLESKGATVIMTRDKDENCKKGATGYDELQCRVDIAKKYSADLYISIHANSSTNSSVTGVEVHYSSKNDPEYPGVNKHPKESKLLAESIQKEIVPALDEKNRGVISDNLYVTRKNTSPATLIEIGFISNASELKHLESTTVRNRFAQALTTAVVNYFNAIK